MSAGDGTCVVDPYRPEDEAAVVGLWHRCGLVHPPDDPTEAVHRRLAWHSEGVFVAREGETVVGAIMAGYEGRRGWLNYVAVDPDCRGRGIGRRLVERAESWLASLGCPKINLQIRDTNVAVRGFYESLGYSVDACISLGKRLPR